MIFRSDHFNPIFTLECGQCFRWEKLGHKYIGVVDGAILSIEHSGQSGYNLAIEKSLSPVSEASIKAYFDEGTDYGQIIKVLSEKDEYLKAAITAYKGLRILNQDPFETLITFIISANNNIPKIKMSVEALSKKFGIYIGDLHGKSYYSFPTVEALACADIDALKVKGIGYRAKAVSLTAKKILEENIDLFTLKDNTYTEAKSELMKFYGVGEKVADCVLLFSLQHKEAFPIDTWVKKLLQTFYHVEDKPKAYKTFVDQYFTEYGGYAQQFLFYYMRENKNEVGGKK